jgi:hypothetical protein
VGRGLPNSQRDPEVLRESPIFFRAWNHSWMWCLGVSVAGVAGWLLYPWLTLLEWL